MDKIVIIGSPGAGKSTFAQQLGQALKIEVFHLDRYFWSGQWKEYPREGRIKIQQDLVRGKERWIMEGSYISSADSRFEAADTIIFLDTKRALCLWRVLKRHVTTYRQYERPDIPEGCTDRVDLIRIIKILAFPYRGRVMLLEKIREQEQNRRKDIRILRSEKHIQDFLREQAAMQAQDDMYTACEPVPARDPENSQSKVAPAHLPLACFGMIWVSLRPLFFSKRQQSLSEGPPTAHTMPVTPLAPH